MAHFPVLAIGASAGGLGSVRHITEALPRNCRAAVDPLFASAAATFGERVVGVVLSGRSSDGAAGLRVIRDHGGLVLVEDPAKVAAPQMPMAALAGHDLEVLPLELLARRVARFCSR